MGIKRRSTGGATPGQIARLMISAVMWTGQAWARARPAATLAAAPPAGQHWTPAATISSAAPAPGVALDIHGMRLALTAAEGAAGW
jgi:hypothetical protein